MAQQIAVIKSVDAGIFEGSTLILRITSRYITTGSPVTVELPAASFKTVLTETGTTKLSSLSGELIVVEDTTQTYVKGINKAAIIAS